MCKHQLTPVQTASDLLTEIRNWIQAGDQLQANKRWELLAEFAFEQSKWKCLECKVGQSIGREGEIQIKKPRLFRDVGNN